MLNIAAEHCRNLGLKKYSAISDVRGLVAKEASSLLNGVYVADTLRSRHVGDGETLDGEAAIQDLSPNQDVGVTITPLDDRRATDLRRVHHSYQGPVDSPIHPLDDFFEWRQIRRGRAQVVVCDTQILNELPVSGVG